MSEDESRAAHWLEYAEGDLRTAQHIVAAGDLPPRHACFLCQQAAEKAVKCLLLLAGVEFPRVHDIEALVQLLPASLANWASAVDLPGLTQWAVEARYPGDAREATLADARSALVDASVAVAAAAHALREPGGP
jgi:HEPN domain-containing protein